LTNLHSILIIKAEKTLNREAELATNYPDAINIFSITDWKYPSRRIIYY